MVVILDMFLLVAVHIVLASETVFNRQERETVCQHCHWCSLAAGRLITWKVPHMNVVAGTFGKNKLVLREFFREKTTTSFLPITLDKWGIRGKKRSGGEACFVTSSSSLFYLSRQSISELRRRFQALCDVVQVLFTTDKVNTGRRRVPSELFSVVC